MRPPQAGWGKDPIRGRPPVFVGAAAAFPLHFAQDMCRGCFTSRDATRHSMCFLSILCYFPVCSLLGSLPGSIITTVIGSALVVSAISLNNTSELALKRSLERPTQGTLHVGHK